MKLRVFLVLLLVVVCGFAIEVVGNIPAFNVNSSFIVEDHCCVHKGDMVLIYDISDLDNPILVNEIDLGHTSILYDFDDNILSFTSLAGFSGHPRYRLSVYDFSNPREVLHLTSFLSYNYYSVTHRHGDFNFVTDVGYSSILTNSDDYYTNLRKDDRNMGAPFFNVVHENFAYLKRPYNCILDFSNPDSLIFTDFESSIPLEIRNEIITNENFGYCFYTDSTENKHIGVIDFEDHMSPIYLSDIVIDHPGYTIKSIELNDSYIYAYIPFYGIVIIDASEPSDLIEISYMEIEGILIDFDFENSLAYFYDRGLRTIDISNPSMPFEIDYTPYDFEADLYTSENHELNDNILYINDTTDGLHVLDVRTPGDSYELDHQMITNPGKVAVKNDIAFVSSSEILNIIDISCDTHPQIISKIDMHSPIKTIKIYDSFLCIEKDNHLKIYDISIPSTPIELHTFEFMIYDYYIEDNYLHFIKNHPYTSEDSFHITDISDPTSPIDISSTPCSNFVRFVKNGDIICLAKIDYNRESTHDYDLRISQIDVSNPYEPVLRDESYRYRLSNITDYARTSLACGLNKMYFHNGLLCAVVTNHRYSSHTGGGTENKSSQLLIFDITNPYTPEFCCSKYLSNNTIVHDYGRSEVIEYGQFSDFFVHDNHIFVVENGFGLKVINTSIPEHPIMVDSIYYGDDFAHLNNIFVDDNYAYLTDDLYGFQILDLSTLSISEDSEPSTQPEKFDLTISPNPFNSAVRIDCENESPVEILDITGKVVHTMETGNVWVPNVDVKSGVYIVRPMDNRSVGKNVIYLK